MIVVDTNVIAYLLITGDHTSAARATLARDPEWAAPLLWRSEFRNVLGLYLRRRELSLREAIVLQTAAESLMRGREHAVLSSDVLALTRESARSAYDCEFVALARHLGVPLVTSDRQLRRSFPKHTVDLEGFASSEA
jgi:predicted nucleic acid-binding protein